MSSQVLFQVGASPVTQQEIEAVIDLEQQIQAFRDLRTRRVSQILNRMLNGCPSEAGVHSVNLQGEDRGAHRVFYLVIDGHRMK